jgi:hypothetical protein
MKFNKKSILNFILLFQGFFIIIFLLSLDFEKEYMALTKICTTIYFLLSLYVIKYINNKTYKEEESKDQFNTFCIAEFEQNYHSRT